MKMMARLFFSVEVVCGTSQKEKEYATEKRVSALMNIDTITVILSVIDISLSSITFEVS